LICGQKRGQKIGKKWESPQKHAKKVEVFLPRASPLFTKKTTKTVVFDARELKSRKRENLRKSLDVTLQSVGIVLPFVQQELERHAVAQKVDIGLWLFDERWNGTRSERIKSREDRLRNFNDFGLASA